MHGEELTPSAGISWQVHSYNDLREWHQVFLKGTRWLKIDPHYESAEFCKNQSNVVQDPRGCFVLTHDDPVGYRNYNSTNDVLNFLADPSHSWIFSNTQASEEDKIHIAWCFKYDGDPCDGSSASQNWTALVTELFQEANNLIESLNLNVEFILDGTSTPGGTPARHCLKDLWEPWNATWIDGSDPWRAFFSDSDEDGFERFQIFNSPGPVIRFDLLAELDYGKFHSSIYPYLYWEPSDQETIRSVARSYLNHKLHPPGFRFAINIDTVQFIIYSATESGIAWNAPIASGDLTTPRMVLLPKGNGALVVYAGDQSEPLYQVSQFDQVFSAINSTSAMKLSTELQPQLGEVVSLSSTQTLDSSTNEAINWVLASDLKGNYLLSQFDTLLDELQPQIGGEFEVGTGVGVAASTLVAIPTSHSFSGLNVTLIAATMSGVEDEIFIDLWSWSEGSSSFEQIGEELSISISSISKGTVLLSASIALISDSLSNTSACASPSSKTFSGIAMVGFSNHSVYASYVCFQLGGEEDHLNKSQVVSSSPFVLVAVGAAPTLDIQMFNGEPWVFEVHGEGYCWNSETHNKQPYPATCDCTPVSTPWTLNYNIGSLQAFISHIDNQAIFSACDHDILSGMYDQGIAPSGRLLVQEDSVVALAVHQGRPTLDFDNGDCGDAVPYRGLLLDGWTVPPIFFEQEQ